MPHSYSHTHKGMYCTRTQHREKSFGNAREAQSYSEMTGKYCSEDFSSRVEKQRIIVGMGSGGGGAVW